MKKLRNKITGEINEFMIHKRIEDSEDGNPVYAPFDGNIDEWEDYNEKPKEYWYIDPMVCGVYCTKIKKDEDLYDFNKEIGNYFETEEEAEKAVEKLKAWKRLKDKGFRFKGWNAAFCKIDFDVPDSFYPINGDMITNETEKDLDLLFGGEK